jgi:hypothetical protein
MRVSFQWILVSLCCDGVAGWGTLGHEIVANLAWSRLSKQTRETVEHILGNVNGTDEAGSPLAAVADWADRVRHYKPWSAPLHYIDVRDALFDGGCHFNSDVGKQICEFDYDRDCPNDVCVAGAIMNYTTQLMTTKTVEEEDNSNLRRRTQSINKKEALMFLTQ